MRQYINNFSLDFDESGGKNYCDEKIKNDELISFLEDCVYEYFNDDKYETFIKTIKNESIEWISIFHILHNFREWMLNHVCNFLQLPDIHDYFKTNCIEDNELITKLFEDYISLYRTGEDYDVKEKEELKNVFVSLSDLDSKDDDYFVGAILNFMIEKEGDFQTRLLLANMYNKLYNGYPIGEVLAMQNINNSNRNYDVLVAFKAKNIHGGCYNNRVSNLDVSHRKMDDHL